MNSRPSIVQPPDELLTAEPLDTADTLSPQRTARSRLAPKVESRSPLETTRLVPTLAPAVKPALTKKEAEVKKAAPPPVEKSPLPPKQPAEPKLMPKKETLLAPKQPQSTASLKEAKDTSSAMAKPGLSPLPKKDLPTITIPKKDLPTITIPKKEDISAETKGEAMPKKELPPPKILIKKEFVKPQGDAKAPELSLTPTKKEFVPKILPPKKEPEEKDNGAASLKIQPKLILEGKPPPAPLKKMMIPPPLKKIALPPPPKKES